MKPALAVPSFLPMGNITDEGSTLRQRFRAEARLFDKPTLMSPDGPTAKGPKTAARVFNDRGYGICSDIRTAGAAGVVPRARSIPADLRRPGAVPAKIHDLRTAVWRTGLRSRTGGELGLSL